LIVKKLANAPHQQNFMMLVVAAIATSLDRLELVEFLFPVAQDMWLDATQFADFPDGEVALGRNRWQFLATVRLMPLFHHMQVQRRTSASGWHER